MFKIVLLLSLALTGLQALPISKRLAKSHDDIHLVVQDGLSMPLAEGFRQGSEPSRHAIVDLNTGLVQDYISEINRRTGFLSSPLGNGHGEMERRHLFTDYIADEVPVQRNGGSWVRVEGHSTLPDGFRQGTEPSLGIAEGFRQGTEPSMPLHAGYRQGTERFMPIPDGFRQGTEPSLRLQDGFRQGTEPSLGIQKGFRQGTERFMPIPDGFRQGTEPSLGIPTGFRQGTEPTNPMSYREVALSLKAGQVNAIPDGFRQGTEPSIRIPDGFRQGTEMSIRIPDGFRQGTEPSIRIPDGFRQGTEMSIRIPDGFRQGTEPSLGIPTGFRQGTEPTNPMSYREVALSLTAGQVNTIPDGVRQGTEPFLVISTGFRQGTERFMPLPDDFRLRTEASLSIPLRFRQGTEPTNPIDHKEVALSLNAKRVNTLPDGFRQGTEPTNPLNHKDAALSFNALLAAPANHREDDFRLGAETSLSIPMKFRQGTEPTNPIDHKEVALSLNAKRVNTLPDRFRQGTEPTNPLNHKDAALYFNALPAAPANQRVEGFRPGAGPFMPVRDSDRQDIQPSNHILASLRHVINTSRQKPNTARCNGEIINGRCYVFNPIPMPFLEAQDSCKSLNPSAQLASVTNEDLQSRLVSMVTNGGQQEPVMTWLGATVKNQRASWLDGSEWRYSDWMPGQPNIHTDKPDCVEMFRMDESWWTAADCDFKRASICSYSVVA